MANKIDQNVLHQLRCYRGEIALNGKRENDLADLDKTIAEYESALLEADAKTGTQSAEWRALGEHDPHDDRYRCERAALTLGNLTDDALANEAFLHYDRKLTVEQMMQPEKFKMPIVYMTAIKDRIRWLSRKLEEAKATHQNTPVEILKAKPSLEARMKAAGMLSVEQLLSGAPLDQWVTNAHVKDMESFGAWVKDKRREMMQLQATIELNGKDNNTRPEDDDLYEWAVANAAAFTEVHVNFRKVLHNANITVTTNEKGHVVAVTLQDEDDKVTRLIWEAETDKKLELEEIERLSKLEHYKVCKNWQLILNEYIPLIGSNWQDKHGEVWNFFGLVHSDDDYYYGMINKEQRVQCLSCVGDIKSFDFTLIEKPKPRRGLN